MKGAMTLYTDSMYVTKGINSVFNDYRQPVCSKGHKFRVFYPNKSQIHCVFVPFINV